MGEKDQKLEDGDAKLLIEVEGLQLRPIGSDEPVLRGVDLNVREGDFIGIFGESGCGKTLLCLALSGVIPNNIPAELKGRISYSEELLTQSGVLGVGLVFQNPEYQLLSQTVEDEIAFGPSNLGWDEEDIAEAVSWALKSLGIEHLRDRRIDTLSMGEKQRVAVASVLSMRPKVLILDEPTAYVDPQGCKALLESVRELNEKFKIAIILVEHDLQLLARYARRTYKLEDGRLHEVDVRVEIAKNPSSTADFSGSSPASGKPLIKVENLSFAYQGDLFVLKDVNLEIHQGECVAIVGHNGSGKTTLAKLIMGLLRPTEGRVYLGSREISGTKPEELAHLIGYIFQNPDHQIFAGKVYDECLYGPRNIGIPESRARKTVASLLSQLHISHLGDREPINLSYGEKRRVNIASVLAMETEVIILDEPTCGLDHVNIRRLGELIKRLNRQGKTVIVITHDLDFARAVSHRIIKLERGKIVEHVRAKSSSPLVRLDPLLKLFISLLLILTSFAVKRVEILACINLLLLLAFRLGRVPFNKIMPVWKRFLLGYPAMVLIFVLSQGVGEGLFNSLVFILRFQIIFLFNLLFVYTTDTRKLTRALMRLKLPYFICFMFSTIMRMIPLLSEEARRVLDAQRCRGFRVKRLIYPRNWLPLVLPMLVTTLQRAEQMAISMKLRGFKMG